ncbi:MAG TPA: type III-B CRISPR module RAMP protein Cmr4 [Acetivibrio sp.]|uniref:type III-B CRISPR module RAMP protein Cmr4 n=1 Tax=Acetomicrobium mobile TaxID=97477 RepID=UPI0026F0ACB1|nr:type III-B CRISPR module RAMP protein Cmr4 [Acetomicrobium mobile]HOM97908.1 type III-B CRISPR module RAMP protein Cmr4 [Acetomicrobium sp.]HOQ37984.1 type III-B CRISPR module RAMP protein Cmr4 [Acetivibrio sp.]
MANNLNPKKVFARAIDPIHIGAGGYRLGLVDNTIVRDPATDVPKIPGSSIAGVTREYYTIYAMENECTSQDEAKKRKCAEDEAKKIFGDENKKGTLRFYDGQIILFPVSSQEGTVWITTKELMEYWFDEAKNEDSSNINIPQKVCDKAYYIVKENKDSSHLKQGNKDSSYLKLGWLFLETEKVDSGCPKRLALRKEIDSWTGDIVIISEKLFSHIVNDNLEIRTSVKIDPSTGAAEPGKLFTYEAISRGTVFGFEIGVDKDDKVVTGILNNVSPYFEFIGIGGMGTRGFGRLELFFDGKNDKASGDRPSPA